MTTLTSLLPTSGRFRQPQWRHQAFATAAWLLAGGALLIVVIAQFTDLDLWLADLHYDRSRHAFPWQSTWFAVDLMHGYVKNILVWSGILVIVAALADFVLRPRRIDPLTRTRLRILALSALIEPRFVKFIKDYTHLQCPWSIERYGGGEPLLRILDTLPAGTPLGNCFPAGHASTGMWLVAVAVFWLPQHPRRALYGYLGGLAVGLALGWVQQMRGAHFLTHTLWTAWIASALLLALLAIHARQIQPLARTFTPVSTSSRSL